MTAIGSPQASADTATQSRRCQVTSRSAFAGSGCISEQLTSAQWPGSDHCLTCHVPTTGPALPWMSARSTRQRHKSNFTLRPRAAASTGQSTTRPLRTLARPHLPTVNPGGVDPARPRASPSMPPRGAPGQVHSFVREPLRRCEGFADCSASGRGFALLTGAPRKGLLHWTAVMTALCSRADTDTC